MAKKLDYVVDEPLISKSVKVVVMAVVLLIGIIVTFSTMVKVAGDEIVVHQSLSGRLSVWNEPGWHCQCFGEVTRYKRSSQFWFSKSETEGKAADDAIKTRFADGGHGTISGSIRYDLPLDYDHMVALHRTYHSQQQVEHELINTAVTKAVYLTGSLMTSKESYAERRPDILSLIGDQVAHGVYRTVKKDVKGIDPISGQEKMIALREIVDDPAAPGRLGREEISALDRFMITTTNVSINSIDYDGAVEDQIKAQQKAMMDVQTAQAESKKAEQRALTVKAEGEAEAAKTKWAQEALKATAVTKAEQERDVAKLALDTAKLEKDTAIAEGEGQARKAELIMRSNGYLPEKLAAWQAVNAQYADAFSKQRLVPEIVMGGQSGNSSATELVALLAASTAKQIGLNMNGMGDGKK